MGAGGETRNAGPMRASYFASGREPLKDFLSHAQNHQKIFKDESYEEGCV